MSCIIVDNKVYMLSEEQERELYIERTTKEFRRDLELFIDYSKRNKGKSCLITIKDKYIDMRKYNYYDKNSDEAQEYDPYLNDFMTLNSIDIFIEHGNPQFYFTKVTYKSVDVETRKKWQHNGEKCVRTPIKEEDIINFYLESEFERESEIEWESFEAPIGAENYNFLSIY